MSSVILVNQIRELLPNVPYSVVEGQSVNDWLVENSISFFKTPTICSIVKPNMTLEEAEDSYLLKRDWNQPIPSGCTVLFIPIPQGGSGGGGGSNPLKVILSVALIIVAPYAAPAILGTLGVAATATALAVTAGIITVVGNLVINSVFPPETPSVSTSSKTKLITSQSYSVSSQQNTVSLGQAVGLNYGRNRIVYSYGSKPFNAYASGTYDQYLYMTLIVGVGVNKIPKLYMGDSLVAEASDGVNLVCNNLMGDMHARVILPNQPFMFNPEIVVSDSVSGIELFGDNEEGYQAPPTSTTKGHIVSRSGIEIDQIHFDLTTDGLITANDDGSISSIQTTVNFYAREVDKEGSPVGVWNLLGIRDMASWTSSLPTSGNYQQGLALPVPLFDSNGNPLVFPLAYPRDLQNGIIKNFSASVVFPVTKGNYEVFAVRADSKVLGYKSQNTVRWVGLRGRSTSKIDNSEVTMLQVVVRATSKINRSSITTITGTTERHIKSINPDGTVSPIQFTDSAEDAVLDLLTNTVYGSGNTLDSLSLTELAVLKTNSISRGDSFNLVIERSILDKDLVATIMRSVRTVSWNRLGKWRFVRDEWKPIPVHILTQETITSEPSLSLITDSSDRPNLTTSEYFDSEENTWKAVTGFEPSLSQEKVNKIKLVGVTNHDQAKRETISLVNIARGRRKQITLKVEHEGKLFDYLDSVGVVHEFLGKGQAQFAEYIEIQNGEVVVGCREEFNWVSGATYLAYIIEDGTGISSPVPVEVGSSKNEIKFSGIGSEQELESPIHISMDRENTQVVLGTANELYTRCLVLKNTPIDLDNSTLTLVEDKESDYSDVADWLAVQQWESSIVTSVNTQTGVLTVSWNAFSGALVEKYLVSFTEFPNSGPAINSGTSEVYEGNSLIRTKYIGGQNSKTIVVTIQVIGKDPSLDVPAISTTVINPLWVPDTTAYVWDSTISLTEDTVNGDIVLDFNPVTGINSNLQTGWEIIVTEFTDPDPFGSSINDYTYTVPTNPPQFTHNVGSPYPSSNYKSWSFSVKPIFNPLYTGLGSGGVSFTNPNYQEPPPPTNGGWYPVDSGYVAGDITATASQIGTSGEYKITIIDNSGNHYLLSYCDTSEQNFVFLTTISHSGNDTGTLETVGSGTPIIASMFPFTITPYIGWVQNNDQLQQSNSMEDPTEAIIVQLP